ncbi:MAG: DUF916 domain-containing protein, partial [Chloroflexota bacterium]|nr:DUF916 domain-containing protein [Chloroflexota bacterium]
MASVKSWWRAAIGIAALGLALTSSVVSGYQSDSATPEAGEAATPVVASGVPLLAFAPTESESGFFELTLEPGQSATVSVQIANVGEETYRLVTYAADVYTRVNGGAESRLKDEPISGATEWIDYPTETFDLAPEQELIRDIVVTVPEGTTPGEYTTSVVIQNLDPIEGGSEGGVGMLQIIRQAIAVAITVPGPEEPGLAIEAATYSLAPAYASVLVTVENTGNVRLAPLATMALTDADGTEITNATVQMETFFPGTPANLEFQLVRTLDPGDYRVAVSLEDTAHQVSAGPTDLTMTIEEPEGTPVAETSINIAGVEITEARNADGELQLVETLITIDNPGMQATNARLTLRVTRDGELVEELELGSSLTFPTGPAEFRQRY